MDNKLEYGVPSRFWITIIGMGAGGAHLFTSMVHRIVGNSRLESCVGFILIDQRPEKEFGRGVAWSSSQSDVFLANMRLPTMGLKAEVLAQVKKQLGVTDWHQDNLPEDFQFQVRRIIGEALHGHYAAHVKMAEAVDIPVIRLSDTAIDLTCEGRGWGVMLKNTVARYSDYVVLALGNVPSSTHHCLEGRKGFFRNPWRWDDYAGDLKDARVGIIGLGPTAVDAILFANQQGAKKIVAASRAGKLQYPRPKSNPKEPFTLSKLSEQAVRDHVELKRAVGGGSLSYDELMTLLRTEFLEAKACPELSEVRKHWSGKKAREMLLQGQQTANKIQLWYEIMKAIDVATPFIWHNLTPEARQSYKKDLQSEHQSLSFGMAYKHVNTLVHLLDENGKLTIGKCDGTPPLHNDSGTFSWTVDDKEHELDLLINCTGIGSQVKDFDSSLVQSLARRGWLVAHPDGGFCVEFSNGQVFKDSDGHERLGELYCLTGSMTRGTHLLTNCLGQLFDSCERTAQHVLGKIAGSIPTVAD